MQNELLRACDVTLGYGARPVLRKLSFTIERGDVLGVMGPNGSGKTTLLKAILGLLQPLSGTIEFKSGNGESPRFGYVPQRERLDSHFPLSALEVAVMGRYGKLGPMRRPKSPDFALAHACLERVGIGERSDSLYRRLSGGHNPGAAGR